MGQGCEGKVMGQGRSCECKVMGRGGVVRPYRSPNLNRSRGLKLAGTTNRSSSTIPIFEG